MRIKPQYRPDRKDLEKLYDFVGDFNEAAGWVLIPGKYAFDKHIVESGFNKKHKIFSYNPMEGFFSPLDFTPVGAVSKGYKGVKAIGRGKQLISMGFSGYGRKKVKEGAVKIFTAVGTKLTSTFRPGSTKSNSMSPPGHEYTESGVGGSLPSKPKTPGKHSYVPSVSRYLAYYEGGKGKHENSICRKGYRYVAKSGTLGMCVRK
jgi:hypothetical protein